MSLPDRHGLHPARLPPPARRHMPARQPHLTRRRFPLDRPATAPPSPSVHTDCRPRPSAHTARLPRRLDGTYRPIAPGGQSLHTARLTHLPVGAYRQTAPRRHAGVRGQRIAAAGYLYGVKHAGDKTM